MVSRIQRLIRIGFFFIKLIISFMCAGFLKCFFEKYRNIWIISERGDDARDNGYFFFKYLCDKHPEKNVWFVISSKSSDFSKVAETEKWIEHGSFRHYLFYALSELRISSNLWGGDLPSADYFKKIRNYFGQNKKFVFLKHGIIKDYLPQHCYGEGYPNLYVCGAKPEYEYVKANFGYPECVVQYLGLARFDNLHNCDTKRQILVMPTFRKWLPKMTRCQIEESEYVMRWNQVINDSLLHELLEKNDVKLIFYPHYVMQRYVDAFSSSSERVVIAEFKDYDVQTLLKESKLLITDYSSVFFDFGYMQKPVIYYQFDRERYINEHYDFTKGYFSYGRDGFGDVVIDQNELFSSIEYVVRNDFSLEKKYKERIDNFFPLKDQHNCDRIYQSIIQLIRS